MYNILQILPQLEGEELAYVSSITANMDEETMMQFANIYRSRRKDPQVILILALVGFLGFGGIHRFVLDRVGMGILYILTCGVCFIGTIIDLVNYKKLTYDYNQMQAHEVAMAISRYQNTGK
jgi:TM2 domain-containing membrane protein YozV